MDYNPGMLRFIFWRLVQMPVILAVIFVLTFVLTWMVPGNPLERTDGPRPPREIALAMQREYHLDNSWDFARSYLKSIFLHADFGPSLQYRDQRVSSILATGLPVSAALGVLALDVALIIGLGAGIIGALRPGTPLDMGSLVVALVGVSLPAFVTGSVLLVIFGGLLRWFPVGGWDWSPWYMVLPAVTLGLAPAAYIAQLVRLGLADVLKADFVRTARAKGLNNRQVLIRHAMKVAFLPVLSFLGPAAAVTMTGSFVVERVFAIPGLGEHFVNAVRNKDQFLILGVVLVYASMLVAFNLIVDVAYAWVDPRIELG